MKNYLYNLATDRYKGLFASCIKLFLLALSFVYSIILLALIFFSGLRPTRLKCKVISVGNITLGGTGKSTLVEFIAKYLDQQGHKVAVLTRGYKRKVTSHKSQVTSYEEIGDEPFMLQKHLNGIPVIVDADRVRAGRRAIEEHGADTLILDDGFQQWKIKKDLEIVAINTLLPFGNRHLLPRGILREPLSSLCRADVFVLTKADLSLGVEELKLFLNKLKPDPLILESTHRPLGFYRMIDPSQMLSPGSLAGSQAVLFCGIGDPGSFEALVANLGVKIGLSFRFPDHHDYTTKDIDEVVRASKEKDIPAIITTEKDAARLEGLELKNDAGQILVLRIEQVIKDEERLYNRLRQLYRV